MKATSKWQIAREFTHAGRHADRRSVAPPAASADNATPVQRRAEGVRERAAAGRQTGGHRRFGWLPGDVAGGRPHNHLLDPAESPYLRQAIEMIIAGKSEQTVSRWLAEQRVPTVRGGKWTGTTVRNMVSNPAVCGYRVLGGELVRDPATGEPVVGGWETVATPEEWRRVLRRYAAGDGGGRAAGGPSRKYVLSGFLRCGRVDGSGAPCGATLVGNPVTRGTPHGSYACTSPRCRGLARRMDLVDETVTELVLAELERRYGAGAGGGTGDGEPGGGTGDAAAGGAGTGAARRKWPDSLLAGFTRQRWDGFDLRQKRIAVAAVVESVVVRPLPEGRSTRAPFDPALLHVVWVRPQAPAR